ncbi:MAG: DUF1833 family protein [Geminicoccaceae bacterium]|nr:DUF1833 family protein [Geminicoccaceae bacterium]
MPSPEFIAAAYAEETSEAFLRLLTIRHDDLPSPIRVVHNTVSIVSRGNTFAAAAFDCRLPDEGGDKETIASLSVDVVDREIIEAVRSIQTPAEVDIESVLASDPNTVELQILGMKMRNVKWDASTAQADLVLDAFVHTPYPKFVFDPANFPALF